MDSIIDDEIMTDCCILFQNISISPFSMTPPKTPELKQSDSCNTSDVENNLTYRNVYLTVPGQIPIADYSDTDQVIFIF